MNKQKYILRNCRLCNSFLEKQKQLCDNCRIEQIKNTNNNKKKPNNFCKDCGKQLAKSKYSYCHSCNMKRRWSDIDYKSKVTQSIQEVITKYDINDVRNFIEAKNGKLISENYQHIKSKIIVQCDKGHEWETKFSGMKDRGYWCPYCSGNKVIDPILWMTNKAIARGGKCLSSIYTLSTDKYKFICSNNHEFEMTYSLLKHQDCWCAKCSSGLSERKCLLWFETIFNKLFIKSRSLEFLKLNSKVQLELDGYCEELQIGFEYQGEQHYSDIHNKDGTLFMEKSKYDKEKSALCKENNVKLFTIPYYRLTEIKDVIKEQALDLEVLLPDNFNDIQVDLDKAYSTSRDKKHLNDMNFILNNKNYYLMSNSWTGSYSNYSYICKICKKSFNVRYQTIINNKFKKCCGDILCQ